MAFFPWYLIPKHRSFSSGATQAARLVNPFLKGLIVQFSGSSFRYSGFGSTVKDLCYLLTRGLPNGFPFLRFLGFVRPRLPFEMVYQATDRQETVTVIQVYFSNLRKWN